MTAGGRAPLADMTHEEFRSHYWQQRPLLIPQAFPNYQCPIDPDELAGLALEPEVESRIILERDGSAPWQCEYGPFDEQRFATLPDSHWTLLLQGCNRYVPELAELLERFNFIPSWRLDDVMVSYATDQGSVGPHTDNYDVFLLQARGTRRWQIAGGVYRESDFIPGLDLKILKRFEAEYSWDLQPGDMLYLPPGVAHHGVALGECMTISIGFRAATSAQLFHAFTESLLEHRQAQLEQTFYQDPKLEPSPFPGEIDAKALLRARQQLLAAMEQGLNDPSWFGVAVTELGEIPEPLPIPITAAALNQYLRQGRSLRRNEACRFAFMRMESVVLWFRSGEVLTQPILLLPIIARLCELHRLDQTILGTELNIGANTDAMALIVELINAGFWYCEEELV